VLTQNTWSWAACVFWRRAKANPHYILLSEALFFYQIELLAARTKKLCSGQQLDNDHRADHFVQHDSRHSDLADGVFRGM